MEEGNNYLTLEQVSSNLFDWQENKGPLQVDQSMQQCIELCFIIRKSQGRLRWMQSHVKDVSGV